MTEAFLIDVPYDIGTILLVVLIILGSTAISAIAGFGFGMISVPLLLVVLEPSVVVLIPKVLGTGTGWIVLLSLWRQIRWDTIARILPAALVGLVIGGVILQKVAPSVIQLGVGVLVLISALTFIVRPILIESDTWWATSLVGFLTGVMGNATGLLAPAVVVYFTGRQFSKDVFRATTLALFLTVDLVGLPTLALQGAVSWSDMHLALLLVPAAVAGRVIGSQLACYVSQPVFRRLTILLLFGMALLSIVSAVEGLW